MGANFIPPRPPARLPARPPADSRRYTALAVPGIGAVSVLDLPWLTDLIKTATCIVLQGCSGVASELLQLLSPAAPTVDAEARAADLLALFDRVMRMLHALPAIARARFSSLVKVALCEGKFPHPLRAVGALAVQVRTVGSRL